jgi:hypothetical protein|tara:strand:- start:151 stop:486 length:336 start_codon:yes stop_codon:yes gene_type:complete
LEQLGIPAERIHPITHRLLELFSVWFKPPFYASCSSNFFVFTLSNTLLFFFLFNLIFWRSTEYSLFELGQSALFLGSLIGAVIARLYWLGFERHKLKSWEALGAMLDAKPE